MEKYENMSEKQILDEYLKILEERCEDFKEVQQNFLELSKTFKTYYKYADKIFELHDTISFSSIIFSFGLGFVDNSMHFIYPAAPTFMDIDYNEAMGEKETQKMPEVIEATAELEDYIASMPQTAEAIYFEMQEYYTFLDTYLPKLAHYHGFITGDTELANRIQGYKPDKKLTQKYKKWLSDYLDMNFD